MAFFYVLINILKVQKESIQKQQEKDLSDKDIMPKILQVSNFSMVIRQI